MLKLKKYIFLILFVNLLNIPFSHGVENEGGNVSPAEKKEYLNNENYEIHKQLSLLRDEVDNLTAKNNELNLIASKNNAAFDDTSKLTLKNEASINGMYNYVSWCLGLISFLTAVLTISIVILTVDRYLKNSKMLDEFRKMAEKFINENNDLLGESARKWMSNNEDVYIKRIALEINRVHLISEIKNKDSSSNDNGLSNEASRTTSSSDGANAEVNNQVKNKDEYFPRGESADRSESETGSDSAGASDINIVIQMFNSVSDAEGEKQRQGYREFIEKFGSHEDNAIQIRVAIAMFNLAASSEGEEERQGYRELIERFGSHEDSDIELLVVRSMYNLAVDLQGKEKVQAYSKLIERYGTHQDSAIQLRVARSMFNLAFESQGEEERKGYRELINRFGSHRDDAIQLQVARSMFN